MAASGYNDAKLLADARALAQEFGQSKGGKRGGGGGGGNHDRGCPQSRGSHSRLPHYGQSPSVRQHSSNPRANSAHEPTRQMIHMSGGSRAGERVPPPRHLRGPPPPLDESVLAAARLRSQATQGHQKAADFLADNQKPPQSKPVMVESASTENPRISDTQKRETTPSFPTVESPPVQAAPFHPGAIFPPADRHKELETAQSQNQKDSQDPFLQTGTSSVTSSPSRRMQLFLAKKAQRLETSAPVRSETCDGVAPISTPSSATLVNKEDQASWSSPLPPKSNEHKPELQRPDRKGLAASRFAKA